MQKLCIGWPETHQCTFKAQLGNDFCKLCKRRYLKHCDEVDAYNKEIQHQDLLRKQHEKERLERAQEQPGRIQAELDDRRRQREYYIGQVQPLMPIRIEPLASGITPPYQQSPYGHPARLLEYYPQPQVTSSNRHLLTGPTASSDPEVFTTFPDGSRHWAPKLILAVIQFIKSGGNSFDQLMADNRFGQLVSANNVTDNELQELWAIARRWCQAQVHDNAPRFIDYPDGRQREWTPEFVLLVQQTGIDACIPRQAIEANPLFANSPAGTATQWERDYLFNVLVPQMR